MTKITLTDLANLQNENTATNAINNNNAIIEAAFDNTLSRDGTAPNSMGSTLDMNSFPIINLPYPTSGDSPLRLTDASVLNGGGTITVSPLPTGGTAGQFLVKNSSTNYDAIWSAPPSAIPVTSITGMGTGMTSFLQVPSSANLRATLTDGTGTGNAVFSTSPTFTGNVNISEGLTMTGDITPPQITTQQDDYNPTGLSTASVLRLNSNAGLAITGLAGGTDGRVYYIYNIGSNNIIFVDESGSSTATNRFSFGANLTLGSKQGATIIYDFGLGRWRLVGTSASNGSGSTTNYVTVDSIAALRLLSKTTYQRVTALGYYTAGDCSPRSYYYDSTDTTTVDNGGSVIVAADGGRWKIIGKNNWTCRMFGAKSDGTDQSSILLAAIGAAAAQNIPLEWDGLFSVSTLPVQGVSGLHWIGKGGLTGIATGATDSILQLINVVDLTINGRFVVDGAYNTNYTYGIHAYIVGGGQSCQFYDITNVIVAGCKTAWAFGGTSFPDATISEIDIRGGYTYGCPQVVKAMGTQTVVNFSNANLYSSYGNGNASWQTLPMVGIEAQGATVLIAGGEVLNTANLTDTLFRVSAIAGGAGNQYGNITVTGALMELANGLGTTNNNGLTGISAGAFTMTGCNFVHTHDNVALFVIDAQYAGEIRFSGNRSFCSVARGNLNISSSSSSAKIFFDQESFGPNFLQGYNGVSGGIQYYMSKDPIVSVTYTGTSGSQARADSMINFNPSGTYTLTTLSAQQYPGRTLYFSNQTANAIVSSTNNIILPTGGQTTQIFPANAAGGWVQLVADTSGGNNWRIVAYNYATPIQSVNIAKFTASGTYTVPSNLVYAIVEVVGSGGGGGGVAAVASVNLAASGGGAGGYARAKLSKSQLGSSQTVTIGAVGTGGAAGNNSGTGGSACSLGTLCVAAGGAGGGGAASATNITGPGAGGTGTTGDILISGGSGGGGSGFAAGSQAFYTGFGGASVLSNCAVVPNGDSAGSTGLNYGGGGSGATTVGGVARAGGNGASGIVIITEFLS